jgi:hypothetical protein
MLGSGLCLLTLSLRPKKFRMKSIFPILLLLVVGISCLEEPDCTNLYNNIVGVKLKDAVKLSSIQVAIDSITVEGVPILNKTETLSGFLLPLNYYKNETSFVVYYKQTAHPLVLSYLSQPQFVTADCGTRFKVGSLAVKEHGFSSTKIVNATPGVNATANNVEIYISL